MPKLFNQKAVKTIRSKRKKWLKESYQAHKERNMVFETLSGFPVEPIYTPEHVADFDYLVLKAREQQIPFVAFGDGGNELGTGIIEDSLKQILPRAEDCGCPCHGGIGSAIAADRLIVASVSNWAVTGLIAALVLVTQKPQIMHEPEIEVRSIELCTAFGGVDGLSMSPDAAVDGIDATEWLGLIRTFRNSLYRGMGIIKDWRQLK